MGLSPSSSQFSKCTSSSIVDDKTVGKNSFVKNGQDGSSEGDTFRRRTISIGFDDTFEFLMTDIFNCNLDDNKDSSSEAMQFKRDMSETWDWLRTVLLYNVPKGKHLRGRLVEMAYSGLVRDASEEMMNLARILGWTVEILQAAFLVADDIMDSGVLRRGQPCWHRVDSKGRAALNDTFLLEHAAYQVLHKYFRHLPCYTELLDLCMGITFKTIMGQSLDTRSSLTNRRFSAAFIKQNNPNYDPFEAYNLELYNSIVRYKTGFYTCYLPIAFAMCLAGIVRKNGRISMWENVEKVTLEIGHLYQIQDDYFDCFGDARITGKVGLDIQEGKCTWLFVTAKEILMKQGGDNDYQILKDNYGKYGKEKVKTVKQLYEQLKLSERLQAYQEQVCRNIIELIRRLNHSGLEDVLTYFFDVIYKRTY